MSEAEVKMDVKELSELVVFAISLGEAVEMALADKKLGMEDLPLLMGPFTKAPAAFDGLSKIKGELKDLDSTEMGKLQVLVKEELDLAADKVEAKIEAAVDFLGAIHSFVLAIKA